MTVVHVRCYLDFGKKSHNYHCNNMFSHLRYNGNKCKLIFHISLPTCHILPYPVSSPLILWLELRSCSGACFNSIFCLGLSGQTSAIWWVGAKATGAEVLFTSMFRSVSFVPSDIITNRPLLPVLLWVETDLLSILIQELCLLSSHIGCILLSLMNMLYYCRCGQVNTIQESQRTSRIMTNTATN